MKRASTDMRNESGFTLIELLAVVAIVGILAGLSVPALVRARIAANESAVLGSIRAVNSAQTAYAASAAPGGYAPNFSVLVDPCPASSQGFISPEFDASPYKSGYTFALTAGAFGTGPLDCNGVQAYLGYYLTATPVAVGMTGNRGFASTTPAVIFFDPSGVAPTEAQMAPGGGAEAIQ
jgi:type IV pilus assembly protein PilA